MQWLSIAILIPIGAGAFVLISYFLVKTWLKNQKKRRFLRRMEMEKIRETKALSTKGRHSSARNISQFVIMEEDEYED